MSKQKEYKIKIHTVRLSGAPQLHGTVTLSSSDKNSTPSDDFWYVSWDDKVVAKIYEPELLTVAFELLKIVKNRTIDVKQQIAEMMKELTRKE